MPGHGQDLAPYAEQDFTDTADRAHLVQRLGYACSSFDTLEGDFATLKVGSGTLPGDSVAGAWFLDPFHKSLDEITTSHPEMSVHFECKWAPGVWPELYHVGCGPFLIDTSLQSYADDSCKTYETPSFPSLGQRSRDYAAT